MMVWSFEKRPKMGGASGAAYRSPLTGTGHTREELISREALQNSSDAAIKANSSVSVDFQFRSVINDEKLELLHAMGMEDMYFEHAASQHSVPTETITKFRDPAVPLRLLYIDDWNTRGLGGPVHDDVGDADFFKFCFAIGDADKVDDAGSGGSYGYGKSVFAEASDIRSIFVFSVICPTEENDSDHARLIGLSWFDKHRLQDTPYTGRGFFGAQDPTDNGVVKPLVNDEANELAKRLGFEVRGENDTGLSLLVVGTQVSPESLRESIETHWWPRLLDGSLDVRLFENGKKIDPPRPVKRDDLKPFISCYRIIGGIEEPVPPSQAQGKLQKIGDLELGRWAAVALDDVDAEDQADDGVQNCVALMRTPRMVVEYFVVGRPYRIPIAGVFVADAAADTALKLSEPPAHDRWDQNSSRLRRDQYNHKQVVAKVLERIKANIQRFQDSLQPKEEMEGDRIRELEKILGNLFRDTHPSPPPSPPNPDKRPVEIRLQESRSADGDMAVCRATVRIKVRGWSKHQLRRGAGNGCVSGTSSGHTEC